MDPLRESPHDPVPAGGTRARWTDPDMAHLPWWRRLTIPFEVVIASVVVTAMVLLTVLLVYQVGTGARQAIIDASDDSAQHISMLISERVHHIVDPADATLRLLAFDPIASATSLQARLRRLPVLVSLLEQNALLSAVFLWGIPTDSFCWSARCAMRHSKPGWRRLQRPSFWCSRWHGSVARRVRRA